MQAYTRLMRKSYLKSRLYEELKLHGHIPQIDEDTDPEMPAEVQVMEEMSRHGALKLKNEVPRPAIMDAIVQAFNLP